MRHRDFEGVFSCLDRITCNDNTPSLTGLQENEESSVVIDRKSCIEIIRRYYTK